jgi:AcrR family transcriptional regulator
MNAKRSEKREDLKARLIEAATARIESGGLAGLRARGVTADAGCALGALYNVFSDLDDLIIHVNSATLKKLEIALGEALSGVSEPVETMKALARVYLAFARENAPLWRALFEHRLPAGATQPEWQQAEHEALIEHIVVPLAALRPGMGEKELRIRARTLFAAVHGIVSISLEGRFVGVSETDLARELTRFVDVMATGLRHVA